MAERTRPIRIEFCVTEQERRLIQNKMAQLGSRNMGAYLRKMAIDGYIIKVDYTQQKKLAAAVSRRNWPQPSAGLPAISTRFAAASTAPGIEQYISQALVI